MGADRQPVAGWRRSAAALLAGLLAGLVVALLPGCAGNTPAPGSAALAPPIVFVHGNGDSAAQWMTTLWRFESNGWPRDRLFAVDLPDPLAPDGGDQPQPGRSTSSQARQALAAEVARVLQVTGASQVVLMGNSRGGNEIRSLISQGAQADEGGKEVHIGAAQVAAAILGGTPNHGVWADPGFLPTSEFNGVSPFLMGLNHPTQAGLEITPGPRWLTIRSDHEDKYAQPDGAVIGAPGKPTHVGYDGPELKGAENLVIPGIDHRETAFSPQAFAAAYRFITGHPPATTAIVPEARVQLDGSVSGQGIANDPQQGRAVTNRPLAGATVEVYATDPATGARLGPARWRKTVGADGRWGPLQADPTAHYEFVLSASGYAVLHVYCAPFPRASAVVDLRAAVLPPAKPAEAAAGTVVWLTRPRGYFGLPRDRVVLDGHDPAPGLKPGVPSSAQVELLLPPGPQRPVAARFNDEVIVGQTWPAAGNHLVVLEIQQ
jgi:pimeloyl-ACP methyl ester carboxylesterase